MKPNETFPYSDVVNAPKFEGADNEDLIAKRLGEEGFSCFDLGDTAFPSFLDEEQREFFYDLLSGLPGDPDDPSGMRKRRYATYMFTPATGSLANFGLYFDRLGNAKTAYFQPGDYQPEHGNRVRVFDCLTQQQLHSRVPQALIETDYRIARKSGKLPACPAYIVGFHVMQFEPIGSAVVGASPPVVHRDGELYTFAHLVGRKNVAGGENRVATMSATDKTVAELEERETLAKFTLTEPGQSYVVDDRKVSHSVDPVSQARAGEWSHRTIILVDFSPVRRVRSNDLERMSSAEVTDLQQ